MINKKTFICIGAQKAGTSTLHDIIKQHPEISLPKYKETHFFRDDEKFKKGINYYYDFYFDKLNTNIIGEIDPEYSFFDVCAERIKKSIKNVKIVFILRNPVDRAYSHYLMTKRRGLEDLSFHIALRKEKERTITHHHKIHYSYVSRGLYLNQIERFEDVFGKQNIKIFLFEDLVFKTKRTVSDIINFIGLNPFEFDYDIKSNQASVIKSKILRDFIYKPNILKKGVGKLIPSKRIKDKIMFFLNKKNLKSSKKKELSNKEKNQIFKDYFVEDVNLLEKKLSLDLSHWKYEL